MLFAPAAENWHQTGKKRRTSEFAEPEKKRKPSVVSDILFAPNMPSYK